MCEFLFAFRALSNLWMDHVHVPSKFVFDHWFPASFTLDLSVTNGMQSLHVCLENSHHLVANLALGSIQMSDIVFNHGESKTCLIVTYLASIRLFLEVCFHVYANSVQVSESSRTKIAEEVRRLEMDIQVIYYRVFSRNWNSTNIAYIAKFTIFFRFRLSPSRPPLKCRFTETFQ